jgi:hypothetical protein
VKRLIRLAALLYPAWWRQRYGPEFDALVDDLQPTWRDVADIAQGAITMQMKTLAAVPVLCAVVGVMLGAAIAWRTPELFASTATLRLAPEGAAGARTVTAENVRAVMDEAVDLPGGAKARTLLTVRKEGAAPPVLRVTYVDPDPTRAQHVAARLTEALTSGSEGPAVAAEILAPATRPEGPITPDYETNMASGGGVGFAIGAVAFILLRSRSRADAR